MVVDGLLVERRNQKLASQPREHERDLRIMKTSGAVEGNEVICNKSNYFEKTLIRSCFYYQDIREDNPEERNEPSAVTLSPCSFRKAIPVLIGYGEASQFPTF